MCHSVEMYLPKLTRDAADHAVRAADHTAAARERAVVSWALRLVSTLAALVRPGGAARAEEKSAR